MKGCHLNFLAPHRRSADSDLNEEIAAGETGNIHINAGELIAQSIKLIESPSSPLKDRIGNEKPDMKNDSVCKNFTSPQPLEIKVVVR